MQTQYISLSLITLLLIAGFAFAPVSSAQSKEGNDDTVEVIEDATGEQKRSKEPKVERIHINEGGTKIDELRVQGETKSIQVKPKYGPAYEVSPQPGHQNKSNKTSGNSGWRILSF